MKIQVKLKHQKDLSKKSLIYIQVYISREKRYFQHSLSTKTYYHFFDKATGFMIPEHVESVKINRIILDEVNRLKSYMNKLETTDELSIGNLKQMYLGGGKKEIPLTDVWKLFIRHKQEVGVAMSTIVNYSLQYEYFKHLTFDTYNKSIINKLILNLQKRGLTNTTVIHITRIVNIFIRWSNDNDYSNVKLIKHSLKQDKITTVALTAAEVDSIYNLNIENVLLAESRDIFVLLCTTSLRFSDLKNIRKESVSNNVLTIYHQKTNNKVKIPLNKYSRAILSKYNFRIKKLYLNLFNNDIRKVCEIAKIDELVETITIRNGKRKIDYVQKYKLLSSHVGRRTYITNAIRKNVNASRIMAISGHKTYSSFQKYIQLEDKDVLGLDIF